MVPKTEAIAKMPAKTPPSRNVPTQPSGEIRKSCASVIRLVVRNAGPLPAASRIGVKQSETSTDITTKSV